MALINNEDLFNIGPNWGAISTGITAEGWMTGYYGAGADTSVMFDGDFKSGWISDQGAAEAVKIKLDTPQVSTSVFCPILDKKFSSK